MTIFSSEDYLRSKSDDYGWFTSDDFILPFYVKKRFVFRYLFFATESIRRNDFGADEKSFLNEVVQTLAAMGVDFVHQPATHVVFQEYPDGCNLARFGTYQLDLSASEDDLWRNLHQKHRNVIKKASQLGVAIISGRHLADQCFECCLDTMNRQGEGFMARNEFDRLTTNLGDSMRFYAALKDDQLQGVAVVPWSIHSAYYLLGGSSNNPVSGALNLLHWNIILDMKSSHVKTYDFVGARIHPPMGSKLEGIQRFKKRFGGRLKVGYLWKYIFNRSKYRLYETVLNTKYLLSGVRYQGDIIDQENALAQSGEQGEVES